MTNRKEISRDEYERLKMVEEEIKQEILKMLRIMAKAEKKRE